MKSCRPLWMRILIGVLFPSAVLGVWLYARSGSTAIYCIFYKLTGLYCPGCGSTRAIRAAFNGRLWEAFLCNPLVFVLGIPSLGIVIYEYFRLVFPRLNLKPTILPRKLESFLVILIFVFWILRNIPVFSFLAPG